MNTKPHLRFTLGFFVWLAALSATAQVTQFWDENGTDASGQTTNSGGGAGNWSGTFWYPGTGSADAAWTGGNIAYFGGTPGTVTVNANQNLDGLTFAVSNYTIGGSDTLNLASAATISNNATSGTNTISAILAGSVPVTISATTSSSILALTHANTALTGGVTINPGTTVAITAVTSAGTGTAAVNGTLDLEAGGAANYAFPITGSGTINLVMAYTTGSENIRFDGSLLTGFSGTLNLIADLSSSNTPGAGQLILTNAQGPSMTWNIGAGATFLPNTAVGVPFPAALVILNGAGNSQPYGAMRIDGTELVANVLLNGTGITIGDDSAQQPSAIMGVMSDGGHGYGFTSVVVSGTGKILILGGANTYTGQTVIGGNGETGVLELGAAETPGTSGPLGASAANNPGNILFGGGTMEYSATNNNDYSGRFSTNAGQAFNINVNGQSVTFATALTSSSGTLTLSDSAGGGTLTLAAANVYNGITTVSSGTLNLTGSLAGTIVNMNGGTLMLSNAAALPPGTILTVPATQPAGMIALDFNGTQNITTLNFGASSPQPPGTYGAPGNTNVLYTDALFTGNGILNVQPPTYWDANGTDAGSQSGNNGGGNGNWDNSTKDWWQKGSSDTNWAANNVATFAGTAGTVTLAANVTAAGITFDTTSYLLTNTDGVSVLTLAGTPIINVPGSGTETIACVLGGTAGLSEAGSGTLNLAASNTFTGALAIGSGGTVAFTGTNAFAGAMTIGSGGTLALNDPGSLAGGNYPGAIASSGSIVDSSSINQTLSGLISGAGTITENGPGTLTLTGLNQFTGTITINSGTLTIGGGGDLGNNPTFNVGGYSQFITDNGAFSYDSSAAQTISSGISGSGTLAQMGSGLLTLTGGNSYSGPTTVGPDSTLLLSGGGELGSSDYATNLDIEGTFEFESSTVQTFAGVVSGPGVFLISGNNTQVYLTSSNTYTGPTSIGSGSYYILYGSGDMGDDGSGTNGIYVGNVTNSGIYYYNSSANQTLAGVVSGAAGTITQQGPGTLFLTATNTFTGGMSINGGTITVAGNGELDKGNYAGDVTNAAGFVYNSAASQTMSGLISGSGFVTQNGPGALTLTGAETFAGTISIGAGNLIIGPAGSLDAGNYGNNITDDGAFIYDGTNAQILSGPISGSGAVAAIGTSVLTLNYPDTYLGATIVSNGTLSLTGSGSISDSASVTIGPGATFDVSSLSSPYSFGTTSLSAGGSTTAAATLNGASSGVVSLASVPIALSFTPQTFNGDATHQALNIAQASLTLSGNAITVNNTGASPLGAGTYALMSAPGGITGAPAATVSVGGNGLAAGATASITVTNNNTVNLVVVQSSVPVPAINRFAYVGGNLVLSGTNGPDNGTYYVLTSTNLALPLSKWTPIATNTFGGTGAFNATNAVSTSPSYFIIEIPAP